MQRKEKPIVGEYYHVFNRGVEKRKIFQNKADFDYFLNSLVFFNTTEQNWSDRSNREVRPHKDEQLVELVAYCLNPNHFHLLLKEKHENGISLYMQKVCTGYAMYFNKKNARSGALFQGRYKSVRIENNDVLLYVSAYVNCNSEVHGIAKASEYPWCSYSEYLNKSNSIVCEKTSISGQFKGSAEYHIFCQEKVKGMTERKKNERYNLEVL
jgi:putative transposase